MNGVEIRVWMLLPSIPVCVVAALYDLRELIFHLCAWFSSCTMRCFHSLVLIITEPPKRRNEQCLQLCRDDFLSLSLVCLSVHVCVCVCFHSQKHSWQMQSPSEENAPAVYLLCLLAPGSQKLDSTIKQSVAQNLASSNGKGRQQLF